MNVTHKIAGILANKTNRFDKSETLVITNPDLSTTTDSLKPDPRYVHHPSFGLKEIIYVTTALRARHEY